MKYVVDEISKVVDRMRTTGDFTVDNYTGGIYTMLSSNSLREKEFVSISGSEYKVFDVSSTGFKIETQDSITNGSYKTLAPYYMYGHRLEINNRLKEKNADNIFKFQKYPLVALRMDFEESINSVVHDVNLNIAMLEFTLKEYNAEQRYENVFKPFLYPMYDNFMSSLRKSNFMNLTFDHTKVDRPFWGTSNEEGNVKYIFDDPLDAIELINLNVKFTNEKCN